VNCYSDHSYESERRKRDAARGRPSRSRALDADPSRPSKAATLVTMSESRLLIIKPELKS
jgi:hypothetical protein